MLQLRQAILDYQVLSPCSHSSQVNQRLADVPFCARPLLRPQYASASPFTDGRADGYARIDFVYSSP